MKQDNKLARTNKTGIKREYYCQCDIPYENNITGKCNDCEKPINYKREPKENNYDYNKKENDLF